MEPGENFRIRCTNEEAFNLEEEMTADIGITLMEYFNTVYNNVDDGVHWKAHCALTTVYAAGFLSGSRAIRERKKKK